MSLQAYLPFLVLALLMTVVALIWAVGFDARDLALMVCLIFPVLVGVVSLAVNRMALENLGGQSEDRLSDLEQALISLSHMNAQLIALVFAWGGAAMLGSYTLTRLWWWHSWQYGLGMLAVGIGVWFYASLLNRDGSMLRTKGVLNATAWMSLCQGIGAIVGLVFLAMSGKIEAGRADWVANIIFMTGGSGIACLSLVAAFTHWRAGRVGPAPLIGA